MLLVVLTMFSPKTKGSATLDPPRVPAKGPNEGQAALPVSTGSAQPVSFGKSRRAQFGGISGRQIDALASISNCDSHYGAVVVISPMGKG